VRIIIKKPLLQSQEIRKDTCLEETVDNPEGGSAVRSGRDVAQVPGVPVIFPILRGPVANLPK
jgi:hypothetical protein